MSRVPCHMPRSHGLTLIELVIVSAIIALLAGIIWVALAPAREKGRQVVCMSNLKQIGYAFLMYRENWGGIASQKGARLEYWQLGLPPEKDPGISLRPYLKNDKVLICPSWFLLPTARLQIVSGYSPNYCTHRDVEVRNPYSPYFFEYDECSLTIAGLASFSWVVSIIPDWPIYVCYSHHYFYFPRNEWEDTIFIGLTLPNFSVRKFLASDYAIRLPPYGRR